MGRFRYNGFQSEQRLLLFWYSVVLIGVFLLVLLYHLDREARRMEAAMMLTVQAQLREAAMVKTASLLVQGKAKELKKFVNSNPMDWLNPPPVNYSGIIRQRKISALQGARWYFDEANRVLIYKSAEADDLALDRGPPGVVEFRVSLEYVDRNGNKQYDESVDQVKSLGLQPLTPFKWVVLQ